MNKLLSRKDSLRRHLAHPAVTLGVCALYGVTLLMASQTMLWCLGLADDPIAVSLPSALIAGLYVGLAIRHGLDRLHTLRAGNIALARRLGAKRLRADGPDPRVRGLVALVNASAKAAGRSSPLAVVVLANEPGVDAFILSSGPGPDVFVLTRGACRVSDGQAVRRLVTQAFAREAGVARHDDRALIAVVAGLLVIDRGLDRAVAYARTRHGIERRALDVTVTVLGWLAWPGRQLAAVTRALYLHAISPPRVRATGRETLSALCRSQRFPDTLRTAWAEPLRHRCVRAALTLASIPTEVDSGSDEPDRSDERLRPWRRIVDGHTVRPIRALRDGVAAVVDSCADGIRSRRVAASAEGLEEVEFALAVVVAAVLPSDDLAEAALADLRYVLDGRRRPVLPVASGDAAHAAPLDDLARRFRNSGWALRRALLSEIGLSSATAVLRRELPASARRVLLRRLEHGAQARGRLDRVLQDRALLARVRGDLDVAFPRLDMPLDDAERTLGGRRRGLPQGIRGELALLFDSSARLVDPTGDVSERRVADAFRRLGIVPGPSKTRDYRQQAAALDHALTVIAAQPDALRQRVWHEEARLLDAIVDPALRRHMHRLLAAALCVAEDTDDSIARAA